MAGEVASGAQEPHPGWRRRARTAVTGKIRRAVALARDRVAGAHIALTSNDREILALRDRHRGERGVVVGMGPSLKPADLDLLAPAVSFACNKIYLAFDRTDWRPDYYMVHDTLIAQNNRETIEALDLRKVFTAGVRPYFPRGRGITWLPFAQIPIGATYPPLRFSTNALQGVYEGWTVLYPAMQLAYYMGIRELVLIGVDFSFDVPGRSKRDTEHGDVLTSVGEKNHFMANYRAPGEQWTVPQLDLQLQAFECARRAFDQAGGRIVNASRETRLEVYPRVDFDEVFARP